jgi:hypothetical protein
MPAQQTVAITGMRAFALSLTGAALDVSKDRFWSDIPTFPAFEWGCQGAPYYLLYLLLL